MKTIAQHLGTSTATAYHILNTLVEERMLAKDAQRRYHLGSTCGALARAYALQTTPPEQMMAPLRWLARETGESAYLSAWRFGQIAVLASIEGSHAVRVSELEQGFSGFAHARASGKLLLAYSSADEIQDFFENQRLEPLTQRTVTSKDALLAEFDRIVKRGYSIEQEEFKEGVACVAAPVFDRGALLGAYTVSAPVERFRANRKKLVQATLTAASFVSASADRSDAMAPERRG